MQSLLTRLKASNEQRTASDPQASPDRGDGDKKSSAFNNIVKDVNNNNKSEFVETEIIDLQPDTGTSRLDEPGDEIDIVMASNNKLHSKRRGRSVASSPRETLKTSRTRGSRVSLNSVATSEKEDVSVIDLGTESDDDITTPRRARILTPVQAWAAFEDTVKNIDNSNPYAFMKKPKPTFVSSGTFQKVMVDMYGNTEYGNTKGYTVLKQKLNNMARASAMASRMFAAASQKGKEDRENEDIEESDGQQEEEAQPEQTSVSSVFAKRGWKMLKRQVNETAMEQKTQSGKLNWTMLQHTLKQMTNVERTRQDLYERYGVVPTVREDGTTVCENRMLSDRARAQLYGRGKEGDKSENKRPLSYQPPPSHLRKASQNSLHSNGTITKGRTNRHGLPNIRNTRQRPVTAVR